MPAPLVKHFDVEQEKPLAHGEHAAVEGRFQDVQRQLLEVVEPRQHVVAQHVFRQLDLGAGLCGVARVERAEGALGEDGHELQKKGQVVVRVVEPLRALDAVSPEQAMHLVVRLLEQQPLIA